LTKKKQKLLPLVSLTKNDQEKTNFHHWYPWPKMLKNKKLTVVILGQNDQEKQKLSPLLSLVKNDHKNKTFHLWYPWPKLAKIIFSKTSEARMGSVFI